MRFIPATTITSILILASGSLLLAQHGSHGLYGAAPQAGANAGIRAPRLPAPIGLQHQASDFTAINRGALRSRSEHREGRSRPAYFVAPYYYLPFDYGSSSYDPSGYGYGAGQDPGEQTAEVTGNLLGEQMQRLSNEVEQLRSAQQQPAAGPYLPPGYIAAQPGPQEDPPPPATPVILVLRNGQQVQVQNYAVMDKTFWDFSRQPARRIPLSTIDIAASSKATLANGGDFPQLEEAR